jgi:hypothetical protein
LNGLDGSSVPFPVQELFDHSLPGRYDMCLSALEDLRAEPLILSWQMFHWGSCDSADSDIIHLGCGLTFCISDNLLGNANVSRTTHREQDLRVGIVGFV